MNGLWDWHWNVLVNWVEVRLWNLLLSLLSRIGFASMQVFCSRVLTRLPTTMVMMMIMMNVIIMIIVVVVQ